ncbi:MAG: glycosyltransferase family 39 protein [Bdellovibrionales bacterium]|nr:glycosyltransferase family 39 protein [Bdellovibrionales bacterium]
MNGSKNSSQKAQKENQHSIVISILFIVTAFAVWGQVLGFEFVWDDKSMILSNGSLHRWSTLWRGFLYDFWSLHDRPEQSGYWRPLVSFLHVVWMKIFGPSSLGFHALSLVFHMANTYLVYLLSRRWLHHFYLSLGVSAVFMLHPLQAEAVAFASALPDLMSCFFGLLALYFFLDQKKHVRIWVSIFLVCGLLSKESGISFILFCGFLLYRERHKKKSNAFGLGLMLLSISLVYVVLHWQVTSGIGARVALWGGSIWTHVGTCAKLFAYELSLIFWPRAHSPTREFEVVQHAFDLWMIGGMLLWFAMFVLYWKERKANRSIYIAGYLIFWLPVSNLIPAEGLIADRYMYLLVFWTGLYALDVLAPLFMLEKRLAYGFAAVLGVMSLYAYKAASFWKSDHVLWSHALAQNEYSPLAWNELGNLKFKEKNWTGACWAYQKAASLKEKFYSDAYFNLVGCYMKQGNPKLAQSYLDRLSASEKQESRYYDLYAAVLQQQGFFPQALYYQNKAIHMDANVWQYYYHAGLICLLSRQFERAKEYFEQSKHLGGEGPELLHHFALSLFHLGQYAQSIQVWKKMETQYGQNSESRSYVEKAELLHQLQNS